MRVTLGGADVDLVHGDEVLARVLLRLQDDEHAGRPLHLASANLDHLHHFGLDSGREGAFDDGRGGLDHLVLLDGMPLVWTARRLTGADWELLAGSDLLPELLRTAARARATVGFLGGTARQHRALAGALADRFPGVEVAGFWSPERREVDDPERSAELAGEIRAAGVDLLVVGLGKPRQEQWVLRHGAATGARVLAGFGAAADFLAGTAERAPERWRRLGLEWLHRLLREPRRLARRYLVQGPSSLVRLLTQSRTEELVTAGEEARRRPAPVVTTPHLWRRRVGRLLALADAVVIAVSTALAYLARLALGEAGVLQGLENEVPIALAVIPLWLVLLNASGAYTPAYLNTGGDAFRRFVAGTTAGIVALGFVSFALNLRLARGYVALLVLFVLVLGGLVRVGARAFLRSRRAAGRFRQNVLVLGADDEAVEVARTLAEDQQAVYRPVGFLSDEVAVGTEPLPGLAVLGRPADVLDHAYDTRAGLVLVSPTGVSPGTLAEVTVALEGSVVDVAVAPSLFQVLSRRMSIEQVAGLPILHVDQVRLSRPRAAIKRTLDLVVAGSLLAAASPVAAVAALASRRRGGTALLHQERVGRDGQPFDLLRFRSDLGERWRVPRLPELVNVLRGDLSLVGPRPPRPDEVATYEPWQRRRLRVRPGITGVWQTSGRSDASRDEAVRADLFYIENWSLGLDLFVLGKTLLALLRPRVPR